jgi:hypothetical protein
MISYQIDPGTGAIRFPDGSILTPPYDGVRYLEYAEWVQAGNSPEQAVIPVAPLVGAWRITKTAFRNRFTLPEKVMLEIACLDNPAATMTQRQQAAMLRVSMTDTASASFIDLSRTDTRYGVQMLESAGLLAAGRALIILDTPVVLEERPL